MINWSTKNIASYTLLNQYYTVIETQTNAACFSSLRTRYTREKRENVAYIIIRKTACKETIKYREKWLAYIGKMFKLKYVITEDTFQFKSTKLFTTDLIVCTLVRSLWEGKEFVKKQTLIFFKNMFEKNLASEIKDPLARFCFIWSKLATKDYAWNHHHISENPKLVKLRTTKEFKKVVKSKENIGVMNFFQVESI